MELIQLLDGSQAILSNDPKSFEELLLDKLGPDAARYFHSLVDVDGLKRKALEEEIDCLQNEIDDMCWDEHDEYSAFHDDVVDCLSLLEGDLLKLRKVVDCG